MDVLAASENNVDKVGLVPTASPSEDYLCFSTACARWLRAIIPTGCLAEVKEIMKLAVPLMISQMLIFLLSVVSSIFCGRLGKEELDAAGLANNVKAIMGFSFGIGFCSATDTLLSQTFGRKNMKQIGVILQRSLLMLILICFPCWALFINTENILLLIKQDPKVARLTADYILICIPVLLGMFVYQLQASFLQNQAWRYAYPQFQLVRSRQWLSPPDALEDSCKLLGPLPRCLMTEITVPQVFIGITANIINACLHYVFLFVLHLGVQGAALALNVAVISQIITTFFYIWIKDLHVETWEGWSWECLQNWHQVTKLAIPSILAVLFEWSIYDIGIILTGLISVTEQGVQSVILQIVLFLYMIPYSMGNAVCVRVGNALGAGNADQAKRSSTVALLSSGILIATDITFIGVSRTVIARLFTSDEEIISLSARTLLVYIIFHIFEAIACTSNGILKGMGKQKIGAVVYCIGYYVIGLPLAVILMFVAKFGVLGLWYGMTVGAFVPAFFLTIYILRTNWNTLKEEAEERTGLKQKPASLKCVYTHSSEEEDNRSRILFFESVPNGQPSDQQPVNDLSSPLDATKSDFLPMKTLILRRGLLVMAAVVLLVIGVLVRVWLVHL